MVWIATFVRVLSITTKLLSVRAGRCGCSVFVGDKAILRCLLLAVPESRVAGPILRSCRRARGWRDGMDRGSGDLWPAGATRESFWHAGRKAAGDLPRWLRLLRREWQ